MTPNDWRFWTAVWFAGATAVRRAAGNKHPLYLALSAMGDQCEKNAREVERGKS